MGWAISSMPRSTVLRPVGDQSDAEDPPARHARAVYQVVDLVGQGGDGRIRPAGPGAAEACGRDPPAGEVDHDDRCRGAVELDADGVPGIGLQFQQTSGLAPALLLTTHLVHEAPVEQAADHMGDPGLREAGEFGELHPAERAAGAQEIEHSPGRGDAAIVVAEHAGALLDPIGSWNRVDHSRSYVHPIN